jgi:nicotinate phosphoribosyltransferase
VTATEAAPAVSAAWGPSEVPTTALLTDHYELTMVRAALRAGTANRRCVFELFARRLPEGRRYGVVGGVGRALRALRHFRFDEESLRFLLDREVVDQALADRLADYKFSGDIWGYPEGEVYFPGSPLVIVESTFIEAQLLETLLLSIYNHDSAIAAAASRMTAMAGDRPCIEMGSRRTHELAAVAAARAAYLAGFSSTSNLEAGRRYGVPTRGTSGHSFTLLYATEREAFAAQIAELGRQTTLLVDTYDVMEAVRIGVELTEGGLGAVRLDSGDLGPLAVQVRELLDSLGATTTKIIATGDLDEFSIAALSGAPVDGYGVGTALVTGSGYPTCEFVYKLVARAASDEPGSPMQAVAKRSVDKINIGGRKYALRRLSEDGTAQAEIIGLGVAPSSDSNDRPLLVQLVDTGEIVGDESLETMRQRHLRSRAELPLEALKMSRGDPVIETVFAGLGEGAVNPYQPSPALNRQQ